jgi:transposase
MNDHIRALLDGRQYSEELKEQAVFRVLFGGEDPYQVMESLDIHNIVVLNNWVNLYRKKIETGAITLPPMSSKNKTDNAALQQRNKELERALKDANLMILALNTMIDVTEQDLKISIRKKRGTKRS